MSEELTDAEVEAMKVVYRALKPLEPGARKWVVRTVLDRLGHPSERDSSETLRPAERDTSTNPPPEPAERRDASRAADVTDQEVDGVSPVAAKWMRRNGFSSAALGRFFSIGHEEIDYVAENVPGKSKAQRLKSVLFLKGVAAYLGTGAARVAHDDLRQACVHYSAWDQTHFARDMQGIAREFSGSKEAGYTLTPAGLTSATALVSSLIKGEAGAPTRSTR